MTEINILDYPGDDIGAKCNGAYLAAKAGDRLCLAPGQYAQTTPIKMVGNKAVDVMMRSVGITCKLPDDSVAFTYGSDTKAYYCRFQGPWLNVLSKNVDGFCFRNLVNSHVTFEAVRAARCGVLLESRGGTCFQSNIVAGPDTRAVLSGCVRPFKFVSDGGAFTNTTFEKILVAMQGDDAYWALAPTVFHADMTRVEGTLVRDSDLESAGTARLVFHRYTPSRWVFESCWREGIQVSEGSHVDLVRERNTNHEPFWVKRGTWSFED